MEKRLTRRQRVHRLLKDGGWHKTAEICHPAIGGSEGTRRLRELRNDLRKAGDYDIEKRGCDYGTQYEYRLIRRKRRFEAAEGQEEMF